MPKICEYCDAEFEGHGNKSYCNKECYTEENRIRNREKYVPVPEEERKYTKWHPDTTQKEYEVWHRYGLYFQEYEAMMSQGCGICGAEAKHLDHDHKTGKVREALCVKHNIAIGFAESTGISKIISYLEKHK